MALTTLRDDKNRLFVVTATGRVTFQELLQTLSETRTGDSSSYALLFDANAATELPDSKYARDFVARVRTLAETMPRGPAALVAGSDAIYGALRVYETFYELAGIGETRTFRNVDDAVSWLRQVSPPPATE